MQAGNPDASSIRINFGDRQPTPTPLDVSVTVDFFSPQYDNLRNEFTKKYQGVILPKTCMVFEFEVGQNAQGKAEQLKKLSKQMLPPGQEETKKVNVFHGGDHILLTVETTEFSQTVDSIQDHLSAWKDKSKDNNQINLRMSSHNSGLNIWNSIPQIGSQAAFFSSLHLEFGFIKTQIITQFLQIVMRDQLGIDKFNNMLKSFKKLNVQLNLASGTYLNEFPKVNLIKDYPPKPATNPFGDFLMSSNIEKGRFFVLNKTITLDGNINADGVIALLAQQK